MLWNKWASPTGTCGVKATSEILSHAVQCAGNTQRKKMIGSETRGKLFTFFSALLGIIQVICGDILLLLAATNSSGQAQNPFNTTLLLEITTSLIAITSGGISIAFAIFRGKALRFAALITSILSCMFAICQFLLLVTSAEQHGQCNYRAIESESVTLLGTIISAIFIFFLFERNQSRSEVKDINDAPPPYEVAVQDSNARTQVAVQNSNDQEERNGKSAA